MQLKIFQIKPDGAASKQKFKPYKDIDKVDPSHYDKVFDAQADVKDLEDAFILFNSAERHPLFYGHSLSISDVVVTDDGAFYCDTFGFKNTFVYLIYVCHPKISPSGICWTLISFFIRSLCACEEVLSV